MAQFKIKVDKGWLTYKFEIDEENKELLGKFKSHFVFGGTPMLSLANVLVILDIIGVCDINKALRNLREKLIFEEIKENPPEEIRETKKGFFKWFRF